MSSKKTNRKLSQIVRYGNPEHCSEKATFDSYWGHGEQTLPTTTYIVSGEEITWAGEITEDQVEKVAGKFFKKSRRHRFGNKRMRQLKEKIAKHRESLPENQPLQVKGTPAKTPFERLPNGAIVMPK